MSIRMIGIDYGSAPVRIRELFAFTKKASTEAMAKLKQIAGIEGCVIISTCNRMEIWCSVDEDLEKKVDIYEWLCNEKKLDSEKYKKYFISRYDKEAITHLFYLSSGMKSLIIGEDQILTQIKESLELAREDFATNQVMDVLFRMAITAGKKIKTEVHLSKGNVSAASEAIEYLKTKGYSFEGKKCLVIGNGEMGQLTALSLKDEGADVCVTVRQYRSGVVCIPDHCKRINYGERYDYIPKCEFVFSATASPNTTITAKDLLKAYNNKDSEKIVAENNDKNSDIQGKQIFVDLAVPRDIEPEITEYKNIELFGIDELHISKQSEQLKSQIKIAEQILDEKINEFISWYECRDLIPKVQTISENASKDVVWRMGKTLKEVKIEDDKQKDVTSAIEQTSSKVISKLMYLLRDNLSTDEFRECIDALYGSYGNDSAL